MSSIMTPVIAFGGTFAVMVVFQRLLSNRRGSEQLVQDTIETLTPPSWNFVAMKYCYGILNRTYLVLVTDNTICGARIFKSPYTTSRAANTPPSRSGAWVVFPALAGSCFIYGVDRSENSYCSANKTAWTSKRSCLDLAFHL
jgi:hypothetical protein